MKKLLVIAAVLTFIQPIFGQDIVTGLVGHWPFEGNANDVSGNGNHGSVFGATLTEDRNGGTNRAYLFDGDDVITLNSTYTYSFGSSGSIFTWIRSDGDLSNNRWILNFYEANTYGKAAIYIPSNLSGSARLGFRDNSQTGKNQNSVSSINDGQWHLVGLTYDGAMTRVYIDGVEDFAISDIYTITDFIATAKIGRHPTNVDGFIGAIDDIRIYNRALSASDVSTLFATGGGTGGGTSSLWSMNGSDIYYASGKVGVGTNAPVSSLHITGTEYDGTPNIAGTQIRQGVIEMTRDGGDPFIDFQNDVSGTDYDARLQLDGGDYLKIRGAHLSIDDWELRDVKALQLKDWDDNSGGRDSKYRLLARDGAFQFHNGGVMIANHANGTFTDLADGHLVVENKILVGGTTFPGDYKLVVNGNAITEEVKVQLSSAWPDYVFTPAYQLKSLGEIESFISENGHLPNIPTASEVTENGIFIGEMNAKLLEKIEELTLYLIDQNKTINSQKEELETLKKEVLQLKSSVGE